MTAPEPQFTGTLLGLDWYKVGAAMIAVPTIQDDWPEPIKNAIQRRNTATLTGRCPCGATARVPARMKQGQVQHAVMEHEHDCAAGNDQLNLLARQYGLEFRRAF